MPRRFEESLIVAVRAAAGSYREVSESFEIGSEVVWKIKHGVFGYWLRYTPTIIPSSGHRRERGRKLDERQLAEIKADTCRGWASARVVAATNGVSPLRVMEIWREDDFLAKKSNYEKLNCSAANA